MRRRLLKPTDLLENRAKIVDIFQNSKKCGGIAADLWDGILVEVEYDCPRVSVDDIHRDIFRCPREQIFECSPQPISATLASPSSHAAASRVRLFHLVLSDAQPRLRSASARV